MQSKRDWETLIALRNSPKGKLQYSREWNLEDILDAAQSSPMLSPYSAWVLDNVLQHKELANSSVYNSLSENCSPTLALSSKPGSPAIVVTSPVSIAKTELVRQIIKEADQSTKLQLEKVTEVESVIRLYEEGHRAKMKDDLRGRLDMTDQFSKSFAEKAVEQLKRFEERMELEQRQQKHQLQEQLEKGSKEVLGQQEKLKEEHRHRAKLLTLRLREAEQQRQQEIERVRQEEGRERMRRLCVLQQEALQLIQKIQMDYKLQETLRVDLSTYSQRGNQICGILSNVVRSSSERGFPTQDDVSVGERSVQEIRALVSTMETEVAAAEERRKAEAEAASKKQKEAEQQQQAKALAPVPAQASTQPQTEGLQEKAAKGTMQRYRQTQNICEQCLNAASQLHTCKEPELKKIKAELQKAVIIPVSQISSKAGSLLREIFDKINNLLLGKPVLSGGRQVAVSLHSQGLDFVCYKLAERFVKQGEEEVASHHEAAFPIAMVVSGIWELHPRVGDLFLAHLYKKCPYAVPYYPSLKQGTSTEDFHRMLGYQVEGSKVEQQDNFLKRMSGMIRLYAAIIQSHWPYGTKRGAHPHGLHYGWLWMAQLLNLEPLADVTATLLFDFLEVCGNALLKQYQGQFWKLLSLIKEEYLPRIERITTSCQMGSVSRLKQFLDDTLQRGDIPVPKGYLQSSFWRS
ncbi:mRNA export factor GLE1 [Pseudophryne corroboree]|uniref:mRNA export factor GLE1 n=1 Tax=Pseudophryne corroboree TaxID=495146 RepID=UPI00308205C9